MQTSLLKILNGATTTSKMTLKTSLWHLTLVVSIAIHVF